MKLQRIAVLCLALTFSWPASAQDNSQVALQRAQAMLRQINTQKTALEAQVKQLEQKLAASQSDLKAAQDKARQRESKFKGAISDWKEEYSNLRDKFMALAQQMRETIAARDELSFKLEATTKDYQQCFANNHDLVALNEELLASYKDKGVWAALSQREPVTGLGKVKMENMVQTYRHSISDLDLSLNHQ